MIISFGDFDNFRQQSWRVLKSKFMNIFVHKILTVYAAANAKFLASFV
jgi:hypothetical protein